MEALLHHISLDIGHAEEVTFISDNSPTYRTIFHILPSFVLHLTTEFGLRAVHYIYTCSQLSEILSEAQFFLNLQWEYGNGEALTPNLLVNAVNTEQTHFNVAAAFIGLEEDFHSFSSFIRVTALHFPFGDKDKIEYGKPGHRPCKSGGIRWCNYEGRRTTQHTSHITSSQASASASPRLHCHDDIRGEEISCGVRDGAPSPPARGIKSAASPSGSEGQMGFAACWMMLCMSGSKELFEPTSKLTSGVS